MAVAQAEASTHSCCYYLLPDSYLMPVALEAALLRPQGDFSCAEAPPLPVPQRPEQNDRELAPVARALQWSSSRLLPCGNDTVLNDPPLVYDVLLHLHIQGNCLCGQTVQSQFAATVIVALVEIQVPMEAEELPHVAANTGALAQFLSYAVLNRWHTTQATSTDHGPLAPAHLKLNTVALCVTFNGSFLHNIASPSQLHRPEQRENGGLIVTSKHHSVVTQKCPNLERSHSSPTHSLESQILSRDSNEERLFGHSIVHHPDRTVSTLFHLSFTDSIPGSQENPSTRLGSSSHLQAPCGLLLGVSQLGFALGHKLRTTIENLHALSAHGPQSRWTLDATGCSDVGVLELRQPSID